MSARHFYATLWCTKSLHFMDPCTRPGENVWHSKILFQTNSRYHRDTRFVNQVITGFEIHPSFKSCSLHNCLKNKWTLSIFWCNFLKILMNAFFFSISVNTKTFCGYVIVKNKFLRIFYVLLFLRYFDSHPIHSFIQFFTLCAAILCCVVKLKRPYLKK